MFTQFQVAGTGQGDQGLRPAGLCLKTVLLTHLLRSLNKPVVAMQCTATGLPGRDLDGKPEPSQDLYGGMNGGIVRFTGDAANEELQALTSWLLGRVEGGFSGIVRQKCRHL